VRALVANPIATALVGLAVGAAGGSAATAVLISELRAGPESSTDRAPAEPEPAAIDMPSSAPPRDESAARRSDQTTSRPGAETTDRALGRRPASPPPAAPSELDAERQLLERARSALARGRAEDALLALMEHERRFPGGAMREERDGLTVQALAAAGRPEQARLRAARFREEHPESMLGGVVDEAVRDAGRGD
jgi:hypothetical protein